MHTGASGGHSRSRRNLRRPPGRFSSLPREKAVEESTHRVSAPTVTERYPSVGAHLDRVTQFRLEVYGALVGGGATSAARRERDARLREVARRYGLSTGGIGGT